MPNIPSLAIRSLEQIARITTYIFTPLLAFPDLFIKGGEQLAACCDKVRNAPRLETQKAIELWDTAHQNVLMMRSGDRRFADSPVCAECDMPWSKKGETLLNCSRCKMVSYCSKDCQKRLVNNSSSTRSVFCILIVNDATFSDWKSHRKSCASS